MKIRLNELPEEGEDYRFDSEKEPLKDPALSDDLGKAPYSIQFSIRPMDQVFSVNGDISTEIDQTCSKCGETFKMKMDIPINEIVCLEEDDPRNSSYSKANNFSDMSNSTPSVTKITEPVLNVAPFIYELIAVGLPSQPFCGHSSAGQFDLCAVFGDNPNNYDEDLGEHSRNRPFSDLKNILKKN